MKYRLLQIIPFALVSVGVAAPVQLRQDVPAHEEMAIDVGKVTLKVTSWGSGAALILLHGGSGPIPRFGGIAPKIAAAGFRVLAVSRRGFADSKGPLENLTLHDYASDVAGVIKEITNGPAHVLGHAYGNRVARCVATDYPHLVKTLTLLAAGGEIPGDNDAMAALAQLSRPETSEAEQFELARFSLFSPQTDASVVSAYLASRKSWPDARAAQSSANRTTPLEEWWAGGEAPMLVLQGLDDRVAPPANGRNLKEKFGDRVRLVELEGAGHLVPIERPDAVVESIVTFLGDHPISDQQ